MNFYTLLYKEFKNDDKKLNEWVCGLLNSKDEIMRVYCRKVLANLIYVSVSMVEPNYIDFSMCSIFEKYMDTELKNKLRNKIANSRGVFSPTRGKEESELSSKNMEYFERLRIQCPKLADAYYDISRGYKVHSENESTLAKRSKTW